MVLRFKTLICANSVITEAYVQDDKRQDTETNSDQLFIVISAPQKTTTKKSRSNYVVIGGTVPFSINLGYTSFVTIE